MQSGFRRKTEEHLTASLDALLNAFWEYLLTDKDIWNNKGFVSKAIKEDSSCLKYASEELQKELGSEK